MVGEVVILGLLYLGLYVLIGVPIYLLMRREWKKAVNPYPSK